MATPVMRNYAEALLREEEHLAVPSVGAQRPPVREGYDRAFAPVLVIDLCSVFCSDCSHGIPSFALFGRFGDVCPLGRCAIATAGKLAATQALPIRNLQRDMPTLIVVSLSIAPSPFVRFKSIVGTFLSGLKQLFHCLKILCTYLNYATGISRSK
jgi:hypothetical protein